MTQEETRELAEFGAEFLGFPVIAKCDLEDMELDVNEKRYDLITEAWHHEVFDEHTALDYELPEIFFEDLGTSPILAHLAKREMESKVAHFCTSWTYDADGYTVEWIDFEGNGDCRTHKNEYIALWLAIRGAVK